MISFTELEPWVQAIPSAIFQAQIRRQEVRPHGWQVLMGQVAWYRIRATPFNEMVRVGVHAGDQRITATGLVCINSIMGVPAREDPEGPDRMWRLADSEGLTLAWGECP